MLKAEVAEAHAEMWHSRTHKWEMPPTSERRAVVAGSNPKKGNIGSAIADRLRMDFRVVLDVDPEIAPSRTRQGGGAIEHQSFEEMDTLILANGFTHLDWIENQPAHKVREVIERTLTASVLAVRRFASDTLDDEVIKNIVFVGSMAHESVLNGSAPYCAAKAGLAHFARCCAWELAPKGFRVFIIHPSNTEGTPMTRATIEGLARYRDISIQEAGEYWAATRALPRWLQAGTIADIVYGLVTVPEYEWLAGAQLNLGGGTR